MTLRRLTAYPPILALIAACAAVLLPSPAHAVGDRDCGDFASQKAAQIFFLKAGGPRNDPHRLDDDGDGIACESNPAPYYYGKTLPKPPQRIRSTATVSLSRAAVMKGERTVLRTTVAPRMKRTVVLQWWDGRWKRLAQRATSRTGKLNLTVTSDSRTRFRAVLPQKKIGNRIYLGATSGQANLTIQRQTVALKLSKTSVVEGGRVTLNATAKPVRQGRSMRLEEKVDGSWVARSTKKASAEGKASWKLTSAEAGTRRFRVRAMGYHGAAATSSATRALVVKDVTPPAVPQGLVATAGDGVVDLTWTEVADAQRYDVSYRSVGSTTWTSATSVTSASTSVPGLTNDTPYEFRVRAVDQAGNASANSAVVTATPLAPPPAG